MTTEEPELELRLLGDEDIPATSQLMQLSFGMRPDRPLPERLRPGASYHGVFRAGRLVGAATDLHDQQWWGGRVLEASDIAGVGVAPDARGQGIARMLIRAVLAHAHEREAVVSALFPSISTVYRSFGWARAGSIDVIDMPATTLPRSRPSETIELREATTKDLADLPGLYQRVAIARNGMISRAEERFRGVDGELPSGIDGITVALADGELVGYCSWTRGSDTGPTAVLTVSDVLAITPAAGRALLTMLGSWQTVTGMIRLRLLHGDVISDLLPLELGTPVHGRPWMHRPIDLVGAVAGRGWPVSAAGRAVFAIEDPLAPWNTGTWELAVEGGVGQLRPTTADTSVRLTVNGFASLYCGLSTIDTVIESGHLSGPHEDAAALGLLASSTPPHLLDSF
ncbi:MAG TPA: GNAT family N-acetyltransferase [Pseudonocardiaceae bacterium]|jgi:predicted acetyltransferase|nr:GNAT family N-acetyltransferase [Pseudonocardiaceae bacterium]